MHEKDLLGVTLGNCTLERLIGKGGMALVFLAQQARPTRTVAVKVLLPHVDGSDPEQQDIFLERFRREADTIATLEHQHILPLYEYAEATLNGQRLAYLVMPYIRGGTLRQRIDEMRHEGRQFDLPTVASLLAQMADALDYAHSLGVVHRDIKPGNLLFHSDGRLVLADFGIVRLSALPSLTIAGSFIGTAEYASPEQVSGGELDARSDIYALGIILYELLTGSVPFTGNTPFAVMARQLHDPVPSLRTQRPDLSPALDFVVKKALAKDPNARYQHASELAADLQAAITPALAQPAGLRLSGDAGNDDLTVANSAGQPSFQMHAALQSVANVAATPVLATAPAGTPLPMTEAAYKPAHSPIPPPAGGTSWPAGHIQMIQVQATPELEEDEQVHTYRPSRRLYFYSIGLITLVLQILTLGLTLNHTGDTSAIVAGVLLGNALNLLALGAIIFTGITRQREVRSVVQRMFWIVGAALTLSSLFIGLGDFGASTHPVPLISFVILLLTNIYALRALSKVDAGHEQIEAAPVFWRAASVGALTGLIPLLIILVFAFMVPLPANSTLFMRLLGVLVISLIGAPTPGAMMAVWLSHKMSFPILVRTSGIAGLLMFVSAYVLVLLTSLVTTGQALFLSGFTPQTLPLALGILGALLGLLGLLRGMFDAWIYHRYLLRRR